MQSSDGEVVAIVGPTGVGKTEVSILLAEHLRAEIVSADSRLLYRGMDIGTAKPSPEQRARIPHHLVDVADPREPWSLAEYRGQALKILDKLHRQGRLVLLVGGTGQYIRAILEGWNPPPRPRDDVIRNRLEEYARVLGPAALHARLEQADPSAAAGIDSRNVRRVVRALEILQTTGLPPSQQRTKALPSFRCLRVGLMLPRRELYARIDARLESMLDEGLVEEVRRLLESGLPPDSPPMSAIGYRQIVPYLRGEVSRAVAVQAIRKVSREFVRRQANWFKADDPSICWFASRPGVEDQICDLITHWRTQPR